MNGKQRNKPCECGSGTTITLEGTLNSVSKDGSKAQVIVKAGAYRGTHHCVYQRTIKVEGDDRLIQEWHTIPNKRSADVYRIITGIEK